MENIIHPSYKSELQDRILWFDGDFSVTPEKLPSLLLQGVDKKYIFVTEITPEIKKYNKLSETEFSVKQTIKPFDFSWKIPKAYKNIDVEQFVLNLLQEEIKTLNKQQQNIRIKRTKHELQLYKKYKLFDVLKTVIYIIDMFEQNNVVWGVGRGSSVSSYVLYLIGVHDVDSVEFGLEIEEFLHG